MIAMDTLLEPFLFLSAQLVPSTQHRNTDPPVSGDTDGWRDDDVQRAASLLHRAYPVEVGRHFAPHGEPEEWLRYVATLVEQAPCGAIDRAATRVVRDGERLQALALVTFMHRRPHIWRSLPSRPTAGGRVSPRD